MNYDQQGTGEPIMLIPYLSADHAWLLEMGGSETIPRMEILMLCHKAWAGIFDNHYRFAF